MNDGELIILHNKILELVEYFDKFCKENNITYYLMGGTALGAMRHQGFIPGVRLPYGMPFFLTTQTE